jgi:hypothetical protein
MVINEADLVRMKTHLAQIPDPRREWGNLRHKLTDMVVIGLCATIIGDNEYDAMEDWALECEEWLRGFLELPNGIPDKDTFRRLFERLDPPGLLRYLNGWLNPPPEPGGRDVTFDGKTICGSGKGGDHDARMW